MAYAAAVLEQDGAEVSAIDACAERLQRAEFLERCAQQVPDVTVLEVSTPTIHEDLRTVAALREELGYEGKVLLAGLHKPLYESEFLAQHPDIDGTFVGEYEHTLRDLVRAGAQPSEPLPGLIWRTDKEIWNGGRKESTDQLDSMPWPARHLFPMEHYHDLPGGIPSPSVQMWGSRGCSFTCNFCAWPQILYADNRYRVRTPEAIADEMQGMLEQGYQSIYFDDDTFNLGKRRTAEIASTFSQRGIDVPWAFMGRADTCAPEQFEDLARTGLSAVKFGVESADSGRLKEIGKNLQVQQVRDAVRMVKSQGIKVHLTFMFGLQGETPDSMQRTLDLAYELDPDSAQFTVAVPFPGSRLHEELHEQGRLEGLEYEDLDGYRTGVVSTDALGAEQIVGFVQAVHRRWEKRLRPTRTAPKIPIVEMGGRDLVVGLLARAGNGPWLEEALARVASESGDVPPEILVVVDGADPSLVPLVEATLSSARIVSAEASESAASMANRVLEATTGNHLLLLQEGVLPRKGCFNSVLEAFAAHPQAGALALPLHRVGGHIGSSALSVSRWGRVLPHRESTSGAQLISAVSSVAGAFRREMLEETSGFDPTLVGELGDADLCVRALLLGYRSMRVDGPGFDAGDSVALMTCERDASARGESRAWARSRVRMVLRSLPREALEGASGQVIIEGLADLYRASRDRRHPHEILRGFLDGLVESRAAIDERRKTLGRRRVGEDFVRETFRRAEVDMEHCRWQRVLQSVSR
jgi:radical SAM superfamily enzyme YgiQ (UPF0313 family)